jgi:deazaflavin-dependent oxidoreductase (nitroreductase family)
MSRPAAWDGAESFAYLTTTGRRSGREHTIEIWFGLVDDSVYMLAGGGRRSDWVRNLIADQAVSLQIAEVAVPGRARLITDPDEDRAARELLAGKYQGWGPGRRMSGWAETAVAIAIDV